MRKNKKLEALGFVLSPEKKGRRAKKLTHEFVEEATQRFLEKGGEIKQLKYMDKLADIDDIGGIMIRQNNPVIDPTVYENKWGWADNK